LLYQIFLVVLSAVGVFIIFVLIQLIGILVDVKRTTTIVSARTTQLDIYIGKTVASMNEAKDLAKSFILSFNLVKKIINKMNENKK